MGCNGRAATVLLGEPMQSLNYHHLLYFWMVAREGGLAPAGKALRLSQSSLSGQIKRLEEQLGLTLFERRGRKLELTETAVMENVATTAETLRDLKALGLALACGTIGLWLMSGRPA